MPIRDSPNSLIWQSTPLVGLAVLITLALFWPLVGGIALWSLAGVCLLVFAFGIWKQARRG